MKTRTLNPIIALLFAAFTLAIQHSTQADTFGSGANTFDINFFNIGNAGNAADTTSYGAVPYEYRIGSYEISQDAITKATAGGMTDVTACPPPRLDCAPARTPRKENEGGFSIAGFSDSFAIF